MAEYWEVARRRRWWILLSAVAVFVGSAVFAFRMPNVYRAETVILVDPQQVPDRYVTSTVTANIADRLSTLQQQVLSPTRLKRLIESEGLFAEQRRPRSEQELIKAMQNSINIEVVNPGGTRLSAFRIAYHDRNRAEVAKVANRLAQMFIDENLKVREQQSEGTAEFLDSELRETKRQLQQKEEELGAIKSRNILDLPESKQYHLEALANLRSQLDASRERVTRAQQDKAILQSMLASPAAAPTIDLDNGSDGIPRSPYHAEIQKLEMRLGELQRRYGSRHPDVRKAQDELDALKARAAAEEQAVESTPAKPANSSSIRRRNPVLEAQIQKLDQEIEEQTRLQSQLDAQLATHVANLQRVPIFEQQIAGLLRDYDMLRQHYSNLLDKKLSAEMASALESHQKAERFVILDPAVVPDKPYAPNRSLISLAGLVGGLLGGLVLAVLVEMNDESIRTEGEAARILGKPVLVGIPHIVNRQERQTRRLRAAGVLVGTVACSGALAVLLSIVVRML